MEKHSVLSPKMTGVKVHYQRLAGSGPQGRWYFIAEWQDKVFHIEHQPNSSRFTRAVVLREGAYRMGDLIRIELGEELVNSFVDRMSDQIKKLGLNGTVRRNEERMKNALLEYCASVVLQNCHPHESIIEKIEKRTAAYLESGMYEKSTKSAFTYHFGSNVEGWWFLREVPA